MFIDDTIAAIATAPGEGGIGIIRISGEKSLQVAQSIFKSKSGKMIKDYNARTLIYGTVVDNEKVIDEVLVAYMKGPNSYTAEDVMMVTKMADGKLVWLEKGSESAGFQHILKHSEQLADRGISKDNIIDVMYELLNTTPIGTGSNAKGRYADYLYNNKVTRICYGDNGFIVSMFPRD